MYIKYNVNELQNTECFVKIRIRHTVEKVHVSLYIRIRSHEDIVRFNRDLPGVSFTVENIPTVL